ARGIAELVNSRAPYPDVAVHVVEAERARIPPPHRAGDRLGIGLDPGIMVEPGGIVAEAPAALAAGAAGILPLRLGRQAVLHPFPLREPFAEGDRVVPADLHDRLILELGPPEAGIAPVEAGVGNHLRPRPGPAPPP